MTFTSQTITLAEFAKTIDHSLLQPQLTDADVSAGCLLAQRYHAASVCVKPYHVKLAALVLHDPELMRASHASAPQRPPRCATISSNGARENYSLNVLRLRQQEVTND
ncbi:MAG: hypothetical protein JNJ50_02655 [Acidobacteria bacterium]|nr:hypothetical protein [Acidobacteriota bacterium]